MDFYKLEPTGDLNNEDLCLIEDPPEGMGIEDYCMALGEPAEPYFPKDAKIYLRHENPGIEIGGLIGNTKNYLILSSAAKEIIKEICAEQTIEYLTFTLYNHKKRIHTSDYFFINPIGAFDCLNEAASGLEIDPDDDNEVIGYKALILDKHKILSLPDLFRIDRLFSEYIISQKLYQRLIENEITNIIVKKLEVK